MTGELCDQSFDLCDEAFISLLGLFCVDLLGGNQSRKFLSVGLVTVVQGLLPLGRFVGGERQHRPAGAHRCLWDGHWLCGGIDEFHQGVAALYLLVYGLDRRTDAGRFVVFFEKLRLVRSDPLVDRLLVEIEPMINCGDHDTIQVFICISSDLI